MMLLFKITLSKTPSFTATLNFMQTLAFLFDIIRSTIILLQEEQRF